MHVLSDGHLEFSANEHSSGMQNPVVTVFFLTGNMQLLAPLISLLIETRSYCQSPLKSKPMLFIALFYTILAYSTILTPWVSIWNPLHLFNFPQSFRWELSGQIVILTLVYTAVIRLTRRILDCYERRRLRPV